jgi:hypothetical protein
VLEKNDFSTDTGLERGAIFALSCPVEMSPRHEKWTQAIQKNKSSKTPGIFTSNNPRNIGLLKIYSS